MLALAESYEQIAEFSRAIYPSTFANLRRGRMGDEVEKPLSNNQTRTTERVIVHR